MPGNKEKNMNVQNIKADYKTTFKNNDTPKIGKHSAEYFQLLREQKEDSFELSDESMENFNEEFIPDEDTDDYESCDIPRYFNPESAKIIKKRLKNNMKNVSRTLYIALSTLDPMTIKSIKDNKILFYIIAPEKVLINEQLKNFTRPLLSKNDRVQNIYDLENDFTNQELRIITASKGSYILYNKTAKFLQMLLFTKGAEKDALISEIKAGLNDISNAKVFKFKHTDGSEKPSIIDRLTQYFTRK